MYFCLGKAVESLMSLKKEIYKNKKKYCIVKKNIQNDIKHYFNKNYFII